MSTIAARLAASMNDPYFALSLPEPRVLLSVAALALFLLALIVPIIVVREKSLTARTS